MNQSTFNLMKFGILGYLFAIIGVIIGFIVISKIIISLKPKKYKKMDNIIMDSFVKKKEEKENDQFEELEEISHMPEPNDKADINIQPEQDPAFCQTDANAKNEPISYSTISSCVSGVSNKEHIAQKRKGEDDSYSIIKQRMKNKK